jgi:hypothetical protein
MFDVEGLLVVRVPVPELAEGFQRLADTERVDDVG